MNDMSEDYSLFLDDTRLPQTDPPEGEWVVARSMEEVKSIISTRGSPSYVTFDHDLGEDVPNGQDVARWMVEHDHLPDQWGVHSANQVGADRIRAICKSGRTSNQLKQRIRDRLEGTSS